MANEVVSFEDSVKLRLKSIVAELIPEDRWDGLVQKAVKEFEQNDLPKLVKTELVEMFKGKIQGVLAGAEWQQKYGSSCQPEVSDVVKKLLIEAAPEMLAGLLGSASQQLMMNFRSQIQNMRY